MAKKTSNPQPAGEIRIRMLRPARPAMCGQLIPGQELTLPTRTAAGLLKAKKAELIEARPADVAAAESGDNGSN